MEDLRKSFLHLGIIDSWLLFGQLGLQRSQIFICLQYFHKMPWHIYLRLRLWQMIHGFVIISTFTGFVFNLFCFSQWMLSFFCVKLLLCLRMLWTVLQSQVEYKIILCYRCSYYEDAKAIRTISTQNNAYLIKLVQVWVKVQVHIKVWVKVFIYLDYNTHSSSENTLYASVFEIRAHTHAVHLSSTWWLYTLATDIPLVHCV